MDSIGTVTLSDVIAQLGTEMVDDVLEHNRHLLDEDGTIFWLADELEELAALVEFERRNRILPDAFHRSGYPAVPFAPQDRDALESADEIEQSEEVIANSTGTH